MMFRNYDSSKLENRDFSLSLVLCSLSYKVRANSVV